MDMSQPLAPPCPALPYVCMHVCSWAQRTLQKAWEGILPNLVLVTAIIKTSNTAFLKNLHHVPSQQMKKREPRFSPVILSSPRDRCALRAQLPLFSEGCHLPTMPFISWHLGQMTVFLLQKVTCEPRLLSHLFLNSSYVLKHRRVSAFL